MKLLRKLASPSVRTNHRRPLNLTSASADLFICFADFIRSRQGRWNLSRGFFVFELLTFSVGIVFDYCQCHEASITFLKTTGKVHGDITSLIVRRSFVVCAECANFDYGITPNITIGPKLTYINLSLLGLSLKGTSLGAEGRYHFTEAFVDGGYVNAALDTINVELQRARTQLAKPPQPRVLPSIMRWASVITGSGNPST